MPLRTLGGGDRGAYLDITVIPDTTLAGELAVLEAAGTEIEGKLVKFTGSNNYEVTSPDDGNVPNGKIVAIEKDSIYTYLITMRVIGYAHGSGATFRGAHQIQNFEYDSISLGDGIQVSGSDYKQVETAATITDAGLVIAVDVPASGSCDVLL